MYSNIVWLQIKYIRPLFDRFQSMFEYDSINFNQCSKTGETIHWGKQNINKLYCIEENGKKTCKLVGYSVETKQRFEGTEKYFP